MNIAQQIRTATTDEARAAAIETALKSIRDYDLAFHLTDMLVTLGPTPRVGERVIKGLAASRAESETN